MIEIVLHQRGQDARFVSADSAATVGTLAADCAGPGAFVWLEGAGQPLDPALPLDAAGVTERCHVHVSWCGAITVEVRYGGDVGEHRMSPAATVGMVLEQAASSGSGFGLTDTERAKHMLVLRGGDAELDWAEHIGSVADDGCVVRLDLQPKERFEG